MPQSIYEKKRATLPRGTYPGRQISYPDGWAYIGETVQAVNGTDWEKVPVWNNVRNVWAQLNALLGPVDYALEDLHYNRVTIQIFDHLNWDYLDYNLTVTPLPNGWTGPVTLPDNTQVYTIKGLSPLTDYTVNLTVNLVQGGTSPDSIQEFSTPEIPIPEPPRLTSPLQKNAYIDLAWTSPPGDSAVEYRVYRAKGEPDNAVLVKDQVSGTETRVTGLEEDTRYSYYVTGVNEDGLEGPKSNILKWATGHDTKTSRGSIHAEPLFPLDWSSWRKDIGWWEWKALYYDRQHHHHDYIYQGYWQADPIFWGPTWGIDRPEQAAGRYRGCIVYNQEDFRRRLEARNGGLQVWRHLQSSYTAVRRVYRQLVAGTVHPVHMEWYLTNTQIHTGSEPPIYFGHRNNYNSPDAVAAHDTLVRGQYHDQLRLPRGYGHALVQGRGYWSDGSSVPVNGLMLFRDGHQNTGGGAAGYGRWSGHFQRDPNAPHDAWRVSDWIIDISGDWNFEYESYKAPYQW